MNKTWPLPGQIYVIDLWEGGISYVIQLLINQFIGYFSNLKLLILINMKLVSQISLNLRKGIAEPFSYVFLVKLIS